LLRRAERDDRALAQAIEMVGALPSLRRRKLIASFAHAMGAAAQIRLAGARRNSAMSTDHMNEDAITTYARILIKLRELGASNRTLGKFVGCSEATVRRMFASNDAGGSENHNEANGHVAGAASNDASPPLKAILKNLPRLTAAERDVVHKELDIADIMRDVGG
jgi:hypothetical protein